MCRVPPEEEEAARTPLDAHSRGKGSSVKEVLPIGPPDAAALSTHL